MESNEKIPEGLIWIRGFNIDQIVNILRDLWKEHPECDYQIGPPKDQDKIGLYGNPEIRQLQECARALVVFLFSLPSIF